MLASAKKRDAYGPFFVIFVFRESVSLVSSMGRKPREGENSEIANLKTLEYHPLSGRCLSHALQRQVQPPSRVDSEKYALTIHPRIWVGRRLRNSKAMPP